MTHNLIIPNSTQLVCSSKSISTNTKRDGISAIPNCENLQFSRNYPFKANPVTLTEAGSA
jgi:hypothetical protein